MSRTFAIIPAAGKSTRMGRPKLALPLGNRLVIERVIDALRQGGADHILVIVAPHVPELMTLAQPRADVLMLAGETPDMRATVEAGLRWLENRFAPRPDDRWLLVPADHPVLDFEVVRRLIATRARHPDCSIVLPAYAGRRGHPALIDWKHVAAMQALPSEFGLNVYLRDHTEETYELLVDSPTSLLDLDTPEDYERLQKTWDRKEQKGRWRPFWIIWLLLGFLLLPSCFGLEMVMHYLNASSNLARDLAALIGFLALMWVLVPMRMLWVWLRSPRSADESEK